MKYAQQNILQRVGLTQEARTVLKNTYFLLALNILMSALTAHVAILNHAQPSLWWFLGSFLLIFAIRGAKTPGIALTLVFLFTALMGYLIGPVISFYLHTPHGNAVVANSLLLTGTVFIGLSAYVLISGRDFSYLRAFINAGLILMVACILISFFVHTPLFQLVYSAIVALLMSVCILWQTSNIVTGQEKSAISATIQLYLNLLNLFMSLLQITSFFSNDR